MDKAEIALIAALKEKGLDDVADQLLLVLDDREKRLKALEAKILEDVSRYEAASRALSHFTELELKHYTELKAAFPDADLSGHRMYHEKLIKSAEAQEQFWITMKAEMLKKGFFWATIAILGMLAVGFQVKIKAWLGL